VEVEGRRRVRPAPRERLRMGRSVDGRRQGRAPQRRGGAGQQL